MQKCKNNHSHHMLLKVMLYSKNGSKVSVIYNVYNQHVTDGEDIGYHIIYQHLPISIIFRSNESALFPSCYY